MSDKPQHKARGNVMFHAGDVAGAAREYRAAVAADPKDPNAHTLLGNALFEQGDTAGAEASFRAALGLDAGARDARRGLATVLLRGGRMAEARAELEALVRQAADDPTAHASLGKVLRAQGDLDGAEKQLREALALAQNDPSATYVLGLVLAEKNQQAQALEVFDRLEQVTPGKAYAPYGKAVVAARGGRKDEALKWLAVAVERGVDEIERVVSDPAFAALRDDGRFGALIAEGRRRAPPPTPTPKGAP